MLVTLLGALRIGSMSEPNSPRIIDEWSELPKDFDWSKLKSLGPKRGFITACTEFTPIEVDKGAGHKGWVYQYVSDQTPSRWQRFKYRIRKAFWFLFRDEG